MEGNDKMLSLRHAYGRREAGERCAIIAVEQAAKAREERAATGGDGAESTEDGAAGSCRLGGREAEGEER